MSVTKLKLTTYFAYKIQIYMTTHLSAFYISSNSIVNNKCFTEISLSYFIPFYITFKDLLLASM